MFHGMFHAIGGGGVLHLCNAFGYRSSYHQKLSRQKSQIFDPRKGQGATMINTSMTTTPIYEHPDTIADHMARIARANGYGLLSCSIISEHYKFEHVYGAEYGVVPDPKYFKPLPAMPKITDKHPDIIAAAICEYAMQHGYLPTSLVITSFRTFLNDVVYYTYN
ncbi:hypothetical protein [Rhodobacter capsulatus]|uniref:hypothetical protein n=1 Tax=Rhodobacter capsulatus TaxID=1061 RepID=UPI00402774CE